MILVVLFAKGTTRPKIVQDYKCTLHESTDTVATKKGLPCTPQMNLFLSSYDRDRTNAKLSIDEQLTENTSEQVIRIYISTKCGEHKHG